MKMISGVYWDKGKRLWNQDSLMLEQVMTGRGRVLMAAVCDGIGGLAEGENASGYLAEKLTETFYKRLIRQIGKGKGRKKIKYSLLRCFCDSFADLNRYGEGKEIQLGTTVSLLLIWKNRYMIFHLGDSRIYLLDRKGIRQITRDHSDGRNGLTKCVGSFPFQYPDIHCGKIKRNSGFLLCSDGLLHIPSEKMLWEVLLPTDLKEEGQIDNRLKELAAYAMKKGEMDNISALYILCKKS